MPKWSKLKCWSKSVHQKFSHCYHNSFYLNLEWSLFFNLSVTVFIILHGVKYISFISKIRLGLIVDPGLCNLHSWSEKNEQYFRDCISFAENNGRISDSIQRVSRLCRANWTRAASDRWSNEVHMGQGNREEPWTRFWGHALKRSPNAERFKEGLTPPPSRLFIYTNRTI